MAPVFILIGFGLGYLIGKNVVLRNWWYKLLFCIGIPCLIYGVVFLIVGFSCDWWMYMVGAKTATTFLGCIALFIALLIFVKVKKKEPNAQTQSIKSDTENEKSE